jgi:hypothetical protein
MRIVPVPWLALLLVASFGCDGTATQGDGGGGEPGAGGAGATTTTVSATTGTTGTGAVTGSTGIGGATASSAVGAGGAPEPIPPDPPCPTERPEPMTACDEDGLACTWIVGECPLTFTCTVVIDTDDANYCGATVLAWHGPPETDCAGCPQGAGTCVPCGWEALDTPCSVEGYRCWLMRGGNCENWAVCRAGVWTHEGAAGCCAR